MERLVRDILFMSFPLILCLLAGVEGKAQVNSGTTQFSSFETELINKSVVRLKWSVSGELPDSLRFIVERSADGKVFQLLDQLVIHNTQPESHYQYTDLLFSTDSSFYRITERSGEEAIVSDIRKIHIPQPSKTQITIMPNPVFNNASLIIDDETLGEISCLLFDMTGKNIRSYQIRKTSVYMQQILDMYSVPKGEYILVIHSPSINESRRILKQ